MITADQLESHGKVEQCEQVEDKFHIKITEGFSGNAHETFSLIGFITKKLDNKFPNVHKCDTDENLFHLILKP